MIGSEAPSRTSRGIISTFAIAFALALSAPAGAAIGGFEGGDGDQASSCAGGNDWACLPAVLGAADGTGALDDGFVGGAKETQPDTWLFAHEPIQAKADLLGAWMAVTSLDGGRTFLHLAFARAAANGDTYVGIELNQRSATWANTLGTVIPCRTDGDLLVSFEASNSPAVTIHRWAGSGGPAGCPDGRTGDWEAADALSDAFEAAMNPAPVVSVLDGPGLGTPLPVETFGEASLDLGAVADVLGDAAPGACSYFRHLSVKTRSAAEVDSALQDWTSGARLFARACETPDEEGDVTAPAAPSVSAPALACTGAATVGGTGEPGATVTVYDGAAAAGFALVGADGTWSLDLDDLADGAHSLTAEATDVAGNTSVRSGAAALQVDATAPAAPAVTAARTGPATVELSGTAEPGLALTVREGAEVVATATAGPDGAYVVAVASDEATGHAYRVTAADGCRSGAAAEAAVPARPAAAVPDAPQAGAQPEAPAAPAPPGPTIRVLPAMVYPTDALPPFLMGGSDARMKECIAKPFRAYLPLAGVRRARFMVDGKLAATVRRADPRGHYFAVIDPRRYSPGAHELTARVTFRDKRKAVTMTLRFRRCDDGCQSRRAFRIRVPHLRGGERAVRARVFVNGRRVRVVTGRRLRARVVLTGLPRGTYKVEILTRTNRGRLHRSVRRYRTCAGKAQLRKKKN